MLGKISLLVVAVTAGVGCRGKGTFDGVPVTTRVAGTGVSAEVNVLYDGLGFPHVYASSDADAAFALGYAQARDRLFQMDFLRKVARGRLAEYAGDAATSNDVLVRTMFTSRTAAPNGSHHVEDLITTGLSPGLRAFLERYRDGINAYLADAKALRNGAILPPQYLALAILPGQIADWEVEDTVAIGRLQTLQLSDTTANELTAGAIGAAVSAAPTPAKLALFADLTRHAQIVPSVTLAPPASALMRQAPAPAVPPGDLALRHLAGAQASLAGARAFLSGVQLPFARNEPAGSNNWTVSPSLTKDGHALVANDPHLSLVDPANFYLAHLITPVRNVAGVTFPGAPVVVIGHNDRIGWGDTVAEYDVTDLYVETLDAANQTVTFNGQQVSLQPITEHHSVRLLGDRPYQVLLVPHHGPILPGSLDATNHRAISVRWTGQDPTFELQAFFDLDGARSVDEAFTALAAFGVGAQNFNIADVDGHIGYDPHALVPIRAGNDLAGLSPPAGPCQPWLPMPGTGACEWTGFIADADLPQAKDPAARFIATANNDITGALRDNDPVGPDPLGNPNRIYLYAFTDPGLREQRIQKVIAGSSQHTLDTMTSLQADNHSTLAELMLPGLLAVLEPQRGSLSAGAQAALDVLKGWDLSTPTGVDASGVPQAGATSAIAASIFHAFQKRFAQAVLTAPMSAVVFTNPATGQPKTLAPSDLPNEQLFKILVALVQTPPPEVPLATTAAGLSLCQPSGIGPCAVEAATALEETVQFLASRLGADPSTWAWGRLHQVSFAPLAPPLAQLFGTAFAFGPFPNDGGLFTVDVANFNLFATDSGGNEQVPYLQTAGPNVRFSAEMDPAGVKWRAVIPGGQVDRPPFAGLPADPHYEDQIPAWLANQPVDQPFAQADVIKAAKGRVVFTP